MVDQEHTKGLVGWFWLSISMRWQSRCHSICSHRQVCLRLKNSGEFLGKALGKGSLGCWLAGTGFWQVSLLATWISSQGCLCLLLPWQLTFPRMSVQEVTMSFMTQRQNPHAIISAISYWFCRQALFNRGGNCTKTWTLADEKHWRSSWRLTIKESYVNFNLF